MIGPGVIVQDFMLGGDNQHAAPGRPVRGGLWETDLPKRRMQPVYFPEGNHRVLRGFWFVEQGSEWIPLKVGPCSGWPHRHWY